MKRGILIIAVGSDFYLNLAAILVKSIKKHIDIHISLLTDFRESSVTEFDNVIRPNICDFYENGRLNPFKLKTKIYDYSPYEETLYLDADNICIKELGSLFEKLKDIDLQIHEVQRYPKEKRNECSCVWIKHAKVSLDKLMESYNCNGQDYPEYNSSFIWFKKTEKNKEYFKRAEENYVNRKTNFYKIGGCYPDEMTWNITSAQMEYYVPIEKFKPIYHPWETSKRKMALPLPDIQRDYWFVGMASGYHPPSLVQLYNRLSGAKFDNKKKIFHRK